MSLAPTFGLADMQEVNDASQGQPGDADRVTVPQQRIVCIEHPCIIRNVDMGVKSLGGEQNLQKVGQAR